MPLNESLIPVATYADRRRSALEQAREQHGIDGLLIWGRGGETGESLNDVHFYANHFSAYPGQPPLPGFLTAIEHAAVLIAPDGRSTLLATGFVDENAQADEIRTSYDLTTLLTKAIDDAGLGGGKIGLIGSEALPYPVGLALRDAHPNVSLEPVDEVATYQRMRVADGDVEMLQNAADVGTAIVAAIAEAARPGVTEGEAVGAGLAVAAQAPGCVHWAFMIASGPDQSLFVRSGLPAWNPTYVYQPGDMLHIDAYGFVFGYQYDLMRSVVVGADPTPGQARVIKGSRDLIGGIAGLLEGETTARDLRAKSLDLASAAGFDASGNATFGHGINHGWAQPYLQEPIERPDADEPIAAPHAFAFETFLDDGEGNFAKWEDMYAWLPDGVRRLTGSGDRSELNAPLWPY